MKSITVPAELDQLTKVQMFITAELEKCDCPAKAQFQIEIAVEEIFVNIVSYAYRPDVGEATICCAVEENPLRVTIQFLDHGHPFDPLERPEADTGENALLETEGGLGILLVKRNMDDVQYTYENGKNILTIRKRLTD